MSELVDLDEVLRKAIFERRNLLARRGAKLVIARASQPLPPAKPELTVTLESRRLAIQALVAAEVINAGPQIAERLRREGVQPDLISLKPRDVPFRYVKTPKPLFGNKFKEIVVKRYFPDKPVWNLTPDAITEATLEHQPTVASADFDLDSYEIVGHGLHELPTINHSGLCLDEAGTILKYTTDIDGLNLDWRHPTELPQILTDTCTYEDIVPLASVDERAGNQKLLTDSWQVRLDLLAVQSSHS